MSDLSEAPPHPPQDEIEPSSESDAEPLRWKNNLWLFLATVASVFVTGVVGSSKPEGEAAHGVLATFLSRHALLQGAQFAGTLLTILVAHELGHYIAARIHKVPASLPFFIPMPLLSPFGTMGAVIRMRGTIPTRRALLDIGAAGPLAGLVFAIPLYMWGVAHSTVVPGSDGAVQLGESLLLKAMDRIAGPHVPVGHDIMLSPVAFGAWGGLFVTMINLLPVGQLDGGHVAYALFGTKQDAHAVRVHRAMLGFFVLTVGLHIAREIAGGGVLHIGRHLGNGAFWLVWFQVLAILGTLAARGRGRELRPGELTIRVRIFVTIGLLVVASLGRDGSRIAIGVFFAGLALLLAMERRGGVLRKHDLLDHPPTSAAPLDGTRKLVAIVTLALFVLLFMPEPFAM